MLRALLVAITLLCVVPTVQAQRAGAPSDSSKGAQWARASSVGADLYDIDFPGGTIRSYFEGLRAICPTANLIDSADLAGRTIAPLSLRAVSLPTLLQLPQTLAPNVQVELRGTLGGPGPDRATDLIVVLHQDVRPPAQAVFKRYDVSFAGGTIGSYAEIVRKLNPDVSIVIAPGAANLPVPPVELKNVTSLAAVQILQSFYVPATDRDLRVIVQQVPTGVGDDVVLTISAAGGPLSRREGDMAGPLQRVWTIGEAIDLGTRVEDILAAIELSQSLLPAQATIKFHAPSRLLVAVGTQEQLGAIHDVLDRIQQDAHNRPRREQSPAQPAPR